MAAVLSVVLAACSGSTQAGQDDPIKVGTIQTASGAFGQQIFMTVSKAWENWINANGGINGHRVELYVLDDATDPARALSATKELIDQDGVVAIIGSNSTGASTIQKYAVAKGVPIIGGNTASNGAGPLSFPTATTSAALSQAIMYTVKRQGLTKFGNFTCVESAACTAGDAALQQAAREYGVELVASEKVSSTAPDYTASCLSMIKSGAQAVGLATSPQVALKLLQTCGQQGAKFGAASTSGIVLPAWSADPMIRSTPIYVINDVWPPSDRSTPAQQDFVDASQKYAPGMLESPEMSGYVQGTWAGMQMFATAARAGKIAPASTAADVVAALHNVRNETLGGLIGPVTYTQGDTHAQKCYFTSLLENGTVTAPFGTDATCLN